MLPLWWFFNMNRMDEKRILWSVADGIGRLVLNRPPANTMDSYFFHELNDLVHRVIPGSGAVAVVVYGQGRHFSSGADLRDLLGRIRSDKNENPSFLSDNATVFHSISQSDIPYIAAVQGVCLGSAFELALSCRYRFVAEGSVMSLPEATFTRMPGCGGTQLLTACAGKAKAMELILTGREFSSNEAYSWGIFHKITARKQVIEFALTFAQTLIRQKQTSR
jgi:enoyl-CoA hydratase/carnithine racemase